MWPEKEILFKTYAYPFLSLKISFKNCKKIRMTHFNISVTVIAAELIKSVHGLLKLRIYRAMLFGKVIRCSGQRLWVG